MKSKKKFLVLFLFAIMFTFITSVNAWVLPTDNKATFSVGATYSDGVSSIENAQNAHNAYGQMPMLYRKLLTSPTASTLKGSHSNGTPYLQSGIVFLNGHANQNVISFPNAEVRKQTTHSGNTVGLGAFNLIKTSLYIMAGCETAKGTENITKYAVDLGSRTSIGWTTDLSVASFVNWNKRFHDKIKDKTTPVSTAASYANSFIYLFGNVKNNKIYGHYENPWYFIIGGYESQSVLQANEYVVKNASLTKNDIDANLSVKTDEKVIKNLSESYIKNKINKKFNINDYKVEVSESSIVDINESGINNEFVTKYYDYVLYVDGIRTSIGYTIIEEANGEIRLFDNTNDYNIDLIKSNINSVSSKVTNYISTKIKSNSMQKAQAENSDAKQLSIVAEMPYYDVEEGKLYYATSIKVEMPNGTASVVDYLEEIK